MVPFMRVKSNVSFSNSFSIANLIYARETMWGVCTQLIHVKIWRLYATYARKDLTLMVY